ncbi:MAG TPA: AAA family ATPase [Bacteriovoracaceae bacterium]|nr:AAA family ATPase [Bacteriovoracaceae bacterium]
MLRPSKLKSFFLFGARGTGKTTLLKQLFGENDCFYLNLLDTEYEERLSASPQLLEKIIDESVIKKKIKYIIIDEIQKVPKLLDIVHHQVEVNGLVFALTGSSARKLKRGGANLLAGRALTNHLFPFTSTELGDQFDLNSALAYGTLPSIFNMPLELRADYLRSYAETYLKEEIIIEQIIRKIPPFRHFLQVAAQSNTKIINYSKIARDVKSDVPTVQNYFQILEDTLVGFMLPAFDTSVRKRMRKAPKFYFFDCGVQSALSKLLNVTLVPSTSLYGERFEQFVINEIRYHAIYKKLDWEFSYFATKDQLEIDLVVDRPGMPRAFIEIKSTSTVQAEHLRHLHRIKKDIPSAEYYVFSQDTIIRNEGGISCFPWQRGLREIGL